MVQYRQGASTGPDKRGQALLQDRVGGTGQSVSILGDKRGQAALYRVATQHTHTATTTPKIEKGHIRKHTHHCCVGQASLFSGASASSKSGLVQIC